MFMLEFDTKKQALQACVELWDELARTGGTDKSHACWTLFNTKINNSCPCCAFAGCRCNLCPLDSAWRKGRDYKLPYSGTCVSYDKSPYLLWLRASNTRERKVHAKVITDAAKCALEGL